MTTFIVDWCQLKENTITEMWKNHFKFNPLNIRMKDGNNFDMDARIIVEMDNGSTIVQSFGSFSVFVGNTLNVLVRNFFTCKKREDIVFHRLKTQDELVMLLQEKLVQYGVKITTFMIIYTTILSPFVTLEEQKIIIRDTYVIENVSQMEPYMIIYYGLLGGVSFVLLSSVILFNMLSIEIDIKVPIMLCIIISIIIIVTSIYQYSKIER